MSKIFKNEAPNYCSWAGPFKIEFQLFCTVFETTVIF